MALPAELLIVLSCATLTLGLYDISDECSNGTQITLSTNKFPIELSWDGQRSDSGIANCSLRVDPLAYESAGLLMTFDTFHASSMKKEKDEDKKPDVSLEDCLGRDEHVHILDLDVCASGDFVTQCRERHDNADEETCKYHECDSLPNCPSSGDKSLYPDEIQKKCSYYQWKGEDFVIIAALAMLLFFVFFVPFEAVILSLDLRDKEIMVKMICSLILACLMGGTIAGAVLIDWDNTLRNLMTALAIVSGLMYLPVWLDWAWRMPSGPSTRLHIRYLSSDGYFLREDLVVIPKAEADELAPKTKGDRRVFDHGRKILNRTRRWFAKQHNVSVEDILRDDSLGKKYIWLLN